MPFKKRLIKHLYPIYLLLIVGALTAFGLYAHIALKGFYLQQAEEDLLARARFVESQLTNRWVTADPTELDKYCKELGPKTGTRITLILPGGKVIGDSDEEIGRMDNHAFRPEIKEALAGRTGGSLRYSRTLQQRMMYVAVPVRADNEIVGVVRTALPVTAMDDVLGRMRRRVFTGAALIALLTAVLSFVAYRRIRRPMKEMKLGAQRFAAGELDYRLAVPDSGHIGGLAVALNDMAAQLKERIETIVRQRSEQEALLSGMVESVLAVDLGGRLLSMNRSAERMFGVTAAAARGRVLQEIVRNEDLQNFLQRTLGSQQTLEEELVLFTEEEQVLQAHGSLLRDGRGKSVGVLIVLNDITRLKRLENVRREFFANVSHELRTPITSIKAAVETLRDGAPHKPEDTERFLDVIARHSDRLNNLIEDLLALSRLERGVENAGIQREPTRLMDVLQSAVEVCEPAARQRGITLECLGDPDAQATLNASLVEQAVQNLIDNAIKYSDPGEMVSVEGTRTNGQVRIQVRDRGIGIAREHHGRLFERFYRVDRARSRSLGGTGLGLAIVKHIVQAHGGRVGVESTPGQGSTFTIVLPQS